MFLAMACCVLVYDAKEPLVRPRSEWLVEDALLDRDPLLAVALKGLVEGHAAPACEVRRLERLWCVLVAEPEGSDGAGGVILDTQALPLVHVELRVVVEMTLHQIGTVRPTPWVVTALCPQLYQTQQQGTDLSGERQKKTVPSFATHIVPLWGLCRREASTVAIGTYECDQRQGHKREREGNHVKKDARPASERMVGSKDLIFAMPFYQAAS